MVLLAASYIFYFISGAAYPVFILITTVTTYVSACRISDNLNRQTVYLQEHKQEMTKEEKKTYKGQQQKIRSRWKVFGIVVNIALLAVLKYTNFFIENINEVLGIFHVSGAISYVSFLLPLGISFYVLQAVGYLIDVARGTIPAEKNFFRYALFVSFFPQLIQGPISRFGALSQTLYGAHPFDTRQFSYGFQRILWGFFKKLVIADRILPAVTLITGDINTYNGAYALVGMILYTLELYADFTGGIDITIGIAQTFGVTLTENFHRPYFSKSLKEYWRRWHITMCSWFRDYVFYPVSTGKAIQKISKISRKYIKGSFGKHLPVHLSSFAVWFCTGIWHGASWNFILWGLLNWLILMISEELEPVYQKCHNRFGWMERGGYRIFQMMRTLLLICCLNLFDCYVSAKETVKALLSIPVASNWKILWNGELLQLGLTSTDFFVLLVGTLLMLAVSLIQRKGSVREQIAAKPYPVRYIIWMGLFVVILLIGAYGIGYDSSQFIYNRF
jgi:D-alanyl-lipoteichoic acid acyltransferase DltB (MBOAT superfamily)